MISTPVPNTATRSSTVHQPQTMDRRSLHVAPAESMARPDRFKTARQNASAPLEKTRKKALPQSHFSGLPECFSSLSHSIRQKFTNKKILLMQAALDGDTGLVEKYLKHNKRLYVKDFRGNTLLHFAALSGNAETAALLLHRHLSIKTTNLDGYTPVDFANMVGSQEMQTLFKNEAQRLMETGDLPPAYRPR